MKRWTNGLPGATKRLGAKMALRGLAASQPRMRADTHDGPEQIAPLQRPDTLMQLSRSLISEVHLVPHGRAIHFGTKQTSTGLGGEVCCWGQSGHVRSGQGEHRWPNPYHVPSLASKPSFSMVCITSSTFSRTSEWPFSSCTFERARSAAPVSFALITSTI